MANFVLIPGAWCGGWVWRETAALLRSTGHSAYAVTLTGLGERVHLGSEHTNLETHIADVINLLEYEDLHDVVLVAHSYSGIVATGVADRVGQRLAQVVFVDTGPFESGMAYLDFSPPEAQQQVRDAVGSGWRYALPSFEVLEQQASLEGVSDSDRARFRMLSAPQPFGTYTQPLQLAGAPVSGDYGRHVITCSFTKEKLETLAASGEMKPLGLLATPGWHIHELRTGHWPMLSRPNELVTMLKAIGGVDGRTRLVLTRELKATPQKLWAAFTEPARVKQWWGPGAKDKNPIAELDVRVSGRYHIVTRSAEGGEYDFEGEYRDVVPMQKLSFTWVDQRQRRESLVTVTLRPVASGTQLTLEHERLLDEAERDQCIEGWTGALAKLSKLVAPVKKPKATRQRRPARVRRLRSA